MKPKTRSLKRLSNQTEYNRIGLNKMKHSNLERLFIAGLFIISLVSTASAQTNPKKWESSIKAFETADKEKKPQPDSVLFIGSSSIRGWKTMKRETMS